MGNLTDIEASKIAQASYDSNLVKVRLVINQKRIEWTKVDTIQDPNTGLQGYTLKNEDTGEIVISFEGTQTHRGLDQAINDFNEDFFGIVLGGPNYTKREQSTVRYNGSPGQEARINNGTARLNKDGTVTYLNINQFTESDAFVKENINKYGKENVTFVGHSLGGGLAEYYAVQYDADAITFASADVYDLLSDEQKNRVKNGAYRDKIISYTYPDDIVGSWYDEAIGSTYYMSDPYKNNGRSLSTHGIEKNYTKDFMFNKNGYYLPEILYDETSYAQLLNSPLELKNSGVGGFSILIKSAILTAYALDIKKNVSLIEGTRNSLDRFYDFYIEKLLNIKQKYLRAVGTGSYDLLSSADVEEIFSEFGKQEEGVPIIFDTAQYEDIMTRLNHLINDTDEIAFHMDEMGKDFDKKDQELAQWLGLK